jgi:AcrR family transcriptional regulator
MSDQQRQQQRLEISRHAVGLFRAQGVSATSGEQIASAAGVSERTLWRYFRSKESCVEPLLTRTVNAFKDALRSWPPDLELTEHLDVEYTLTPAPSRSDIEAVLAVVRLTRDEPALRAVWLVLQERAEPTFAEVLGERMGLPPDSLEVRIHAASMNTALRVATDDFAWAAAEGIGPEAMDRYRERLSSALRTVLRVPDRAPTHETERGESDAIPPTHPHDRPRRPRPGA